MYVFCRAILLATFALGCVLWGEVSADDLTTSAGKTLKGKLVSVDAEGVTFSTSEAQVKIPLRDLILIDLGNPVASIPKDTKFNEMELTDGTTLRIAKYAVKGKKFETQLLPGPEGQELPSFELPLTAVFSVMRGAEDPKTRESWKKLLASRGKRDLYVMREANGLNFVQGTILEGDEKGSVLNFEREDGTRVELLQRSATGGLVFNQPPPAQLRQTLCKVQDVFGNSLIAETITIGESGVVITTVSGVAFKYASLRAISQLDFARGNLAYLSDLNPQVDTPAIPADEKGLRLNVATPVLRDQGIAGETLRLGPDSFSKGLLIASDTMLTFNIAGEFRELRAVLGIPENSPDADLEAKVTIEADGRVLFSQLLKRKEKPKNVNLDVKGVRQLRVIVESDSPTIGNRIILGEGRLQK
jgi:hypothetical protein